MAGLFEDLIHDGWALIVGEPVYFILVSGLMAALLSVAGESITYWAARLGGHALVQRLPSWLSVDLRRVSRAETMFLRWGLVLIFFGRILPGMRTLVSVPAGMTRMNFGLFLAVSFGGAYLWNTLLVGVSTLLGVHLNLFGVLIL